MKDITLEQLLEAGCHFGHQVTRSNPKARDFIFEARDGIHIIDLAKTKEGLEEAAKYLKNLGKNPGSTLLIVGTKRQSHEVLIKEIERAKGQIRGDSGLYYVTNKWIGGLLTNFQEVSKNFKKLIDLTHNLATPSAQEGYTKKEIGGWGKEREKLNGFYGGVFEMTRRPDALFIIDSRLEDLAVREALRMNVPSVAITDTNADPALVDYAIPANDDAVGSLELIIGYLMDAWAEGKNSIKEEKPKEEKKSEVKKSSSGASAQELVAEALKEEAAKEAKKAPEKNQDAGIKNQEKPAKVKKAATKVKAVKK